MSKKRYLIRATCYDRKGRILSSAENSYTRTHPYQKQLAEQLGLYGKEFLHAEIAAILKAKDQVIHSISIERYGSEGQPLMAKPCPICQQALADFGIKNIFYTVPLTHSFL